MNEKELEEKYNLLSGYALENGDYITLHGTLIKKGEGIKLGFTGMPINMPTPWKLVEAKNVFDTVGYKYEVELTVEATNGNRETYDKVAKYAPKPIGVEEDIFSLISEKIISTIIEAGKKFACSRKENDVE